jgi:hypothetical protein
MHAEDEFTAGTYGNAKRDRVRVLSGAFPVRLLIEGPTLEAVEEISRLLDPALALGAAGHLPIGADKARGAGWGRWELGEWQDTVVVGEPRPQENLTRTANRTPEDPRRDRQGDPGRWLGDLRSTASVSVAVESDGLGDVEQLQLGDAARLALACLIPDSDRLGSSPPEPSLWWCEPTIDLGRKEPPAIFGSGWPTDSVCVDEVAFFLPTAVWRASRSATGWRFVCIREVAEGVSGAQNVTAISTRARAHGARARFAAAPIPDTPAVVREWVGADGPIGFTVYTTELT